MEGPKELTERIEGDIDKILSMYTLAAKAYPYENLHGERSLSDQENRANYQKFSYNEDPTNILS